MSDAPRWVENAVLVRVELDVADDDAARAARDLLDLPWIALCLDDHGLCGVCEDPGVLERVAAATRPLVGLGTVDVRKNLVVANFDAPGSQRVATFRRVHERLQTASVRARAVLVHPQGISVALDAWARSVFTP